MNKLKKLLLSIGALSITNSIIKSKKTKREYQSTLDYYSNIPTSNISLNKKISSKPTIFFLGTDEQQDRSGTLQCLEKLGSLYLFTRDDGNYGQNDTRTGLERQNANTQRLWKLFCELASQNKTPTVLISQTWACLIQPKILSKIRQEFGTAIINISMDDRHQYWGEKFNGEHGGVYPLIEHLDLALTAAPEAVEWYKKEGCPALFFPEASDPNIFYPIPELPKIHDVSFVGACYGIRKKIVDALRVSGVQVTTYGNGWGTGRLDINEVPKLFAQSKIILGVGTIGHCDDFYALKLRDFDAPMSGSFYITNANPDLDLLFKVGEEIETYQDVSDCVKKIQYYLTHEEEREKIAKQGLKRALKEHTWDLRFKAVFDMLRAS